MHRYFLVLQSVNRGKDVFGIKKDLIRQNNCLLIAILII